MKAIRKKKKKRQVKVELKKERKRNEKKKKTILCYWLSSSSWSTPSASTAPALDGSFPDSPNKHGRGFKFLQISKRGYNCLIQQATHITKYSARKTSATQTPTKRHSYLSGKTGKEVLKSKRVTGKVKI